MNANVQGKVIFEGAVTVDASKLAEMATAIGTASGEETARLALWFGPTIIGEQATLDVLQVDNRTLLGSLEYEWVRPFEPGETLSARVFVESLEERPGRQVATVTSEFTDPGSKLVQRQRAIFIRRGEA